jgi:diazepam-binding inhibitor (GABA receptor modulator, acyl-CoA-binding protein)
MSGDAALKESFEAAAEYARTSLPSSLSTADKSKLYGLFKQATEGPVTGERPGIFSPTARVKYDAWKEQEGLDKETAMQQYVDFVESLKTK